MKRLFVALLFVSMAATAFAEETHRYVVSTLGASRPTLQFVQDEDRGYVAFQNLGGFAIDLTESEAAELRKEHSVVFVQKVVTYRAMEMPTASASAIAVVEAGGSQLTPWGIKNVKASDVWPVTRGEGVNVAVVDTGVDYTHPDLKGNYQGGYNVYGTTAAQKADPMDDADPSHGTHVAGTIAASDNAIGVVGVAPNAKIWGVKVLKADGEGSTDKIAAGIDWVIAKKKELGGQWIINMSLGTDEGDPFLSVACQKASDAGVLVIAASGNDNDTDPGHPVSYPAAYPSVVAVGAINPTKTIAAFSNQGAELAVVAPGVSVNSTYKVGKGSVSSVATGNGSYESNPLQGSGTGTFTGNFVYCGLGQTAADFPASVKGQIALIQRGEITFSEKTRNAIAAGASAVVIFNKETGPYTGTLIRLLADNKTPNPDDLSFKWPLAVSISQEDGEALRANPNTVLTLGSVAGDYNALQGTSMATPHVVGVAALLWAAAPDATVAQVIQAMESTASDLGDAGRDKTFGYGAVDAYGAAKAIAPSKFGVGVTPTPQIPNGRRTLKRGK